MRNPFSIKVVGMEKVLQNFSVFDTQAQANLETAISESAKKIKTQAAANAPKRTGKYKKSFKVKGDKLTRYIGPMAGNKTHPIGHLVEFGTQPHGNHPGTPAKPHLFPAFEQERPNLEKKIAESFQKAGGFR